MARPDLNLLVMLDVLLEEGSVTRAGRRLRLSPSATSRALARLRRATGDPLLVRAGRGLVPTPRALELRELVRGLVQDAEAVLRPVAAPDPATLTRAFTLQTSDGFVESFGPELIARIGTLAPSVRLRFLQKTSTSTAPLRDGTVDLQTGVVAPDAGPDIRTRALFRDRLVGVVRPAHPLAAGTVTADGYAAARHVHVSRRDPDGRLLDEGLVDTAFAGSGQARQVVVVVGGFAAALALARGSDLIATVPERQTANLRADLHGFALPFAAPEVTVALLWHARLDADPAHRWLRELVLDLCSDPVH